MKNNELINKEKIEFCYIENLQGVEWIACEEMATQIAGGWIKNIGKLEVLLINSIIPIAYKQNIKLEKNKKLEKIVCFVVFPVSSSLHQSNRMNQLNFLK